MEQKAEQGDKKAPLGFKPLGLSLVVSDTLFPLG